MTPDFALLHGLQIAELTLVRVEGMHHIHFTTYGFAASLFPSLAEVTHADSTTSAGARGVAEQTATFLRRWLR
jgi:hypothetical protein